MKFYWKMPQGLRSHYQLELEKYRNNLKQNDLALAWHHLERAHILGQPWAVEHSEVHWLMLRFGFKIKSGKEIRGQILRLVFGGVKSFVGQIPVGNTGGANVPPLLPMEIPDDLKYILYSAIK
jgi:Protein of unknown function (DUF3703)